jgi:hypothetical protein
MARGWESKSVEAQQAEAGDKSARPKVKLSPEAAARERDRETVRLSRQRVMQQLERAGNPRHRDLLQRELADLDEKLKRLAE